MLKQLGAALCFSVLLAGLPAKADDYDKKTTVKLSGPVELPGIVLPAGTYIFKLVNAGADRHVVQVTDVDGKHVYATIMARPSEKLSQSEKTVITLKERPANAPDAIRTWFYPSDTVGEEFIYPN